MKPLLSHNLCKLCSQTARWSTFFCATLYLCNVPKSITISDNLYKLVTTKNYFFVDTVYFHQFCGFYKWMYQKMVKKCYHLISEYKLWQNTYSEKQKTKNTKNMENQQQKTAAGQINTENWAPTMWTESYQLSDNTTEGNVSKQWLLQPELSISCQSTSKLKTKCLDV